MCVIALIFFGAECDHFLGGGSANVLNLHLPALPSHLLLLCVSTGSIRVTKEGIRFSSTGDLGTGNIMLKNNTAVDKDDDAIVIDMQEPVDLNFALRYLTLFTKATALGPTVTLSLSPDIPIVVEYPVGAMGHIRYYLAPKIDEE